MFSGRIFKLKKFKAHPGHLLLLADNGDMDVLNVYTMMVVKKHQFDFQKCVNCLFKNRMFILCGKIHAFVTLYVD